MPTDIYFVSAGVRITVDQDPSEVADAFTSAGGLPVRLTGEDQRDEVYVNPATVAFWSTSESSSERAALQDPPPAAKERQAVDIWGKPLRKKRSR